MNTPTRSGAPNAQARHTECSSPARELVGLLERSPRANAELLETAIASGTGPRPTAVLSQVEPSVRHSVSRLYDLVTTLRAEDDVAAGLVAEIKSLEEQPARYGYTVELDLPAVNELPTAGASLLRHTLDGCRKRRLAAAPPLSTCHLPPEPDSPRADVAPAPGRRRPEDNRPGCAAGARTGPAARWSRARPRTAGFRP